MRVLLADDHAIVREGLRWMLAGEPDIDIVGEVGDGSQLIEELRARSHEIDVVLLDIRMPGRGGLEALETLAAAGRAKPAVLVLSMHQEPAVVRRAIELGAAGYLLKSSTREQLLSALHHVAAGGCYIQPEVTGAVLDQIAGRSSPEAAPPRLTGRELDVLTLVAAGCANKQIATRLGISETTVKSHLKEVFARLHATNRAEAVARGVRLGYLEQAAPLPPSG